MRRLLARFFDKLRVGEGCWEFAGSTGGYKGWYRVIWIGPKVGQKDYAHRVAYKIANGSIPEGLEIDHTCGNHGCVRPSHLRAVTHKVNLHASPDTLVSIAEAKTHCPKGHSLDRVHSRGKSKGWRYCGTCTAENNVRQTVRRRTRG